ncbi:hypothetical protein CHS0354_032234 [Potamilus streckersoni]|uniref:Decaprenyl-diphosphate synthase subunit 2 n=1 Tax=Potamilus streckersoni TaxID=2493646 RepID=A0AAE0RPY6_9BIVA|nr:hypothetical protein CHS0354_032234 [Potamilus streckersoni]
MASILSIYYGRTGTFIFRNCDFIRMFTLNYHGFRVSLPSRFVSIFGTSRTSNWTKAVSEAEKLVGYPTSFMSLRCLLSDELSNVAIHIRKLLGTRHPLLKTARGFLDNGKHSLQTRGLVVLLISKAAGPSPNPSGICKEQDMISGIYPNQRSLAEIIEMIHMASLIHKGVVNLEDIQPGDGSRKDMEFGNKLSVLSGDFLLASSCTALAKLNNTKVVEIISKAIGNLMEAEFTALKDKSGNPLLPRNVTCSDWIEQTYLSSGCLLAEGCRAAMELANHSESVKDAAFTFGKNMALAQQMADDIGPFLDHNQGLANISITSAPIIRHVESHQKDIDDRLFNNSEGIEPKQVLKMVKSGSAIQECTELCREYGQRAIHSLDLFSDSDAKTALINIITAVTNEQQLGAR